jgi:enoyl-CoA hydratase/carnithine racemase
MESCKYFKYEKSDRIAHITFDRMEKYNAVNTGVFEEMARIMADIGQDPEVGVAILTGQGKAFCAGVDITSFGFNNVKESYDFIESCMRAFRSVEECPKPVIAAVNGFAFGFGFEISFTCDITLASDKASFGLAEIKHGVIPAITITRGLEMVSRKQVAYLAMTGENIDAQTAKELGFVNKVVPHDQLMDEAVSVAKKILQNGPLALTNLKRLLNRNSELHFKDVINFMPGLFMSEDLREGMNAFRERRKAVFKGA